MWGKNEKIEDNSTDGEHEKEWREIVGERKCRDGKIEDGGNFGKSGKFMLKN